MASKARAVSRYSQKRPARPTKDSLKTKKVEVTNLAAEEPDETEEEELEQIPEATPFKLELEPPLPAKDDLKDVSPIENQAQELPNENEINEDESNEILTEEEEGEYGSEEEGEGEYGSEEEEGEYDGEDEEEGSFNEYELSGECSNESCNEGFLPEDLETNKLFTESGQDISLVKNIDSYELFEHTTESGTVVKTYRKKEKPKEIIYKLVGNCLVEDLDGSFAKEELETLEKFSRKQLKDLIHDMKFQLERLKAENQIYDQAVKQIEQRELEIQADIPIFKFTIGGNREGLKAIEKVTDDICADDLSDDEENTTGIYEPFKPATDLDMDDACIQLMSEKSLTVLLEAAKVAQEVAPSNYDVTLHKYGDLVKGAETNDNFSNLGKLGGTGRSVVDIKLPGKDDVDKEISANPSAMYIIDDGFTESQALLGIVEEQDPDFPGFNQRLAKALPVEERLKYCEKMEKALRLSFKANEYQAKINANKITVLTDTYMNSYDILKTINDMFQRTLIHGIHPLTGKLKAEDIVRFKRKMRSILLSEEVKLAVDVTENRKTKKKIDKQIKENKELGESIQAIDYDQLRISNFQYQHRIDEQHELLKELKIITASELEKLKKLKFKVHKKVTQYEHIINDVEVRQSLKRTFDKNFEKYKESYLTIRERNNMLQKKLRQYRAPGMMDYLNYKKLVKQLTKEVKKLKSKQFSITNFVETEREKLKYLETKFPDVSVKKINDDWLNNIKNEVAEKNLVYWYGYERNPLRGSMENFIKRVDKSDSKPIQTGVELARKSIRRSLAIRRSQRVSTYKFPGVAVLSSSNQQNDHDNAVKQEEESKTASNAELNIEVSAINVKNDLKFLDIASNAELNIQGSASIVKNDIEHENQAEQTAIQN